MPLHRVDGAAADRGRLAVELCKAEPRDEPARHGDQARAEPRRERGARLQHEKGVPLCRRGVRARVVLLRGLQPGDPGGQGAHTRPARPQEGRPLAKRPAEASVARPGTFVTPSPGWNSARLAPSPAAWTYGRMFWFRWNRLSGS